jgi:hypothetical protein
MSAVQLGVLKKLRPGLASLARRFTKESIWGRLLAFTMPIDRADRYPAWQFRGRYVRSWIPQVVALLGNGYPALSFLLERRPALEGHNYADLALSGNEEFISRMLASARSSKRD